MVNSSFYRVASNIKDAPVRDYLFHGFEERIDYERALRQLVKRWHDRIGKAIAERNGFLRLRFHDTPGGKPDEEWLPVYLLQPVPMPDYLQESSSDKFEEELNRAFGFD